MFKRAERIKWVPHQLSAPIQAKGPAHLPSRFVPLPTYSTAPKQCEYCKCNFYEREGMTEDGKWYCRNTCRGLATYKYPKMPFGTAVFPFASTLVTVCPLPRRPRVN
jgi:hypothetical protein